MRAFFALVILAGALAFFLTSKEDGRGGPSNESFAADREPRPVRETAIERPLLATEIEADADGHVTIFLGDNDAGDAGDRVELRLNVSGRVLDPRGEPVVGLALDYRANAELGGEPDTQRVQCDGTGAFSLQPTSTYAEFSCEDRRWMLLFAGVEPNGANAFKATLIAAPTTRCWGFVSDKAGHRVEGARIAATGRVEVPHLRNLTGHDFARRVDTDDRGRFDLGFVPLLAPTTLAASVSDLGSTSLELLSYEDRELTLILDGVR